MNLQAGRLQVEPAPELQNFRAAERWIVRRLRLLLNRADEVLHSWEVMVREDAANVSVSVRVEPARAARSEGNALSGVGALEADEFGDDRIRGRVSRDRQPQRAAKKKRRMTAAEFDLDIRERSLARAGAR